MSRYDSGADDLEIDQIDLVGVIRQVLEALSTLVNHTGSELRVDLPHHPVLIDMDQRRVSRILRNLIANGLDHGEGEPVQITLEERESSVAVTVRDHGIGLTEQEAALVFDRFWRSDPARNRTTGGTGLGLAISLEDAKLHGGYLQVAGQRGEGAAFRLVLPRRQDTPVAVPPGPVPFPAEPPPLHGEPTLLHPDPAPLHADPDQLDGDTAARHADPALLEDAPTPRNLTETEASP